MGASIKMSRLPSFDKEAFINAFYNKTVKMWSEASDEYILAAAEIVADHQDTGMSLASLFPAIRTAKNNARFPAISPKVDERYPYTSMSGAKHKGTPKTAALGFQLGTKSAEIGYGTKQYPRFFFRLNIQVFQYILNEVGAGKLTAFYSLPAGEKAMLRYIKKHAKDVFPKFIKYFKAKQEIG